MTESNNMSEKNEAVTFILNFFFAGAGHIYASSTKEGWVPLTIYLLCMMFTPFLIIPILGAIGLWIWALQDSRAVTRRYNEPIRKKEEELEQQKKDAEEKQANKLSGKQFAQQFRKVHTLRSTGIMNDDEILTEKKKIYANALNCWTDEDITDFLSQFASLLSEGIISQEDMEKIKNTYRSIAS